MALNNTIMPLKTERYIAGAGSPASGPLPFSTTKTGTVTTLGTVVTGTGTQFDKELVVGDYIYNTTDNSVRRIVGIYDSGLLRIESPFTTQLAAAALLISRPRFLSVACIATGAATKDGVAIATGQFLSFNSEACVAPFTYSGSITFDVTYLI